MNELMKMLKEEYGINSPEELEIALAKQERIDMTPFCGAGRRTAREAR